MIVDAFKLFIEQIDAILSGFILSERKSRSRQKMNYILAGASTNRLDMAINSLAERSLNLLGLLFTIEICDVYSEELDDDLISYLENLIRKEVSRSLGSIGKSLSLAEDEDDEKEQEKLLQGIGKQTVDVLKMILRRIKAQITTSGRDDLQLLADLLQETNPEVIIFIFAYPQFVKLVHSETNAPSSNQIEESGSD